MNPFVDFNGKNSAALEILVSNGRIPRKLATSIVANSLWTKSATLEELDPGKIVKGCNAFVNVEDASITFKSPVAGEHIFSDGKCSCGVSVDGDLFHQILDALLRGWLADERVQLASKYLEKIQQDFS